MKESEAKEIDEVVITGTGAQKKLTVTGAVTNVDVEVLKSNPTANLSNALAGNVSGVLAMQTSGQPGVNTSEFWIRGISTFGANSLHWCWLMVLNVIWMKLTLKILSLLLY